MRSRGCLVLQTHRLEHLVTRAALPPEIRLRLGEAESRFGVDLTSGTRAAAASPGIAGVLVPGARVCFTGDAVTAAGDPVSREELVAMATARGLAAVDSVTKSKCDVLVTAESGSQSGKSRQAARYGKPVFSAEEFFAWAR